MAICKPGSLPTAAPPHTISPVPGSHIPGPSSPKFGCSSTLDHGWGQAPTLHRVHWQLRGGFNLLLRVFFFVCFGFLQEGEQTRTRTLGGFNPSPLRSVSPDIDLSFCGQEEGIILTNAPDACAGVIIALKTKQALFFQIPWRSHRHSSSCFRFCHRWVSNILFNLVGATGFATHTASDQPGCFILRGECEHNFGGEGCWVSAFEQLPPKKGQIPRNI